MRTEAPVESASHPMNVSTVSETATRTSFAETGRVTPALTMLSFAAGSMDAIAFLALGQVFTSAMSGNTILLGLALGQGHFGAALRSGIALAGYIAGVATASLLPERRTSVHSKLKLEALFLVSFTAVWLVAGGPLRPSVGYALIALSAIAMGIQGAIGRRLGVPGVMTVIFTSTYTAIVGDTVERFRKGDRPLFTGRAKQQSTALSAYLGSAVLCGIIAERSLVAVPFFPVAAILALLVGLHLRLLHLDPA